MYHQTFIFLLSLKITTVQQKNNQPEQSIKSNNQKKQSKISQSIIHSKQNITNTKNHLIN